MKKRRTRVIKVLSFFVAFIMLSTLSAPAKAGPLEDRLNELNQLIRDQNAITQGLREEKETITVQVNASQQQVNNTQAEINRLIASITAKEEEIAIKQDELNRKIEEYEQTEGLFMQRIRAMYMMQDGSTLSTLLGAGSLEEMLAAADNLQRVSDEDMETLALLEEQRLEIEQQRAELAVQLVELEDQKAELDRKRALYAQQLATLQGEAAAINEELQMSQNLLNEYRRAKLEIEAEFIDSPNEYVGGEFIWPVPGYGHISSPYGYRTWSNGYTEFHNGIDIAKGTRPSILGATIVASNSGVVITAKYNAGGYGYYIIIDHGGNNYTVYGHCNTLLVTPGTIVGQGDPIATVGSTGNSTGPHLHFEIRLNGQNVDPYPHVAAGRPLAGR